MVADGEAIQIGELYIKEDEIGLERPDAVESGHAVCRLADDLEPVGFKDRAGERPKARVIVNDQDGTHHRRIVAPSIRAGIRVGTGAALLAELGEPRADAGLGRMFEPCRTHDSDRIDESGDPLVAT